MEVNLEDLISAFKFTFKCPLFDVCGRVVCITAQGCALAKILMEACKPILKTHYFIGVIHCPWANATPILANYK